MDRKKLIGTIIGVVAFIILIAGATYAWLSSNLTVNNATYNSRTLNFLVSYTKGNNINSINLLSDPTPETATSLSITAGLANSTSAPGKMTVYLNTTSGSEIITGGYLKYSWCIGTCGENDFVNHTSVVTQAQQPIIVNTQLSRPSNPALVYNIYLWIDNTRDIQGILGANYSGNISATATQTETE